MRRCELSSCQSAARQPVLRRGLMDFLSSWSQMSRSARRLMSPFFPSFLPCNAPSPRSRERCAAQTQKHKGSRGGPLLSCFLLFQVKGAPRKSKALGADPPPKDGEGLSIPDEYVEDSSDEEVGPPANLWMQHRAGGFLAASPSVQTQREGRWIKELWV